VGHLLTMTGHTTQSQSSVLTKFFVFYFTIHVSYI
jgi:hypothetical protein